MNHPVTPVSAIASLLRHRALVWELVKRDFAGRYKGSYAGAAWSLLNPLFLLAIYTFVFSVAFPARWGAVTDGTQSFAVILFAGMIVYNLFAECIGRAPTLITSTPNYVKKVVFPLEILPWVAFATALLHFVMGLGVLLVISIALGNGLRGGVVWIPVLLLPLALLILGLSWIFASLGVFLRDLAQIVTVLIIVLMFMSPLFYPLEIVPPNYRGFILMSPVTLPIEQVRAAVLWGRPIDWLAWLYSLGVGLAVFMVGFWWFQRSRRGFADVL